MWDFLLKQALESSLITTNCISSNLKYFLFPNSKEHSVYSLTIKYSLSLQGEENFYTYSLTITWSTKLSCVIPYKNNYLNNELQPISHKPEKVNEALDYQSFIMYRGLNFKLYVLYVFLFCLIIVILINIICPVSDL